MTKEVKPWLNTEDGKNKTGAPDSDIAGSKQANLLNSDDIKEDEKRHGLVDEDHPFPSKGN